MLKQALKLAEKSVTVAAIGAVAFALVPVMLAVGEVERLRHRDEDRPPPADRPYRLEHRLASGAWEPTSTQWLTAGQLSMEIKLELGHVAHDDLSDLRIAKREADGRMRYVPASEWTS